MAREAEHGRDARCFRDAPEHAGKRSKWDATHSREAALNPVWRAAAAPSTRVHGAARLDARQRAAVEWTVPYFW